MVKRKDLTKERVPPTYLQKVNALHDIWDFADLIGFRGGRESFGQVHLDLTEFLCEPQKVEDRGNRRRLILAPRGHLKSTVCSVLYTLWRIYRNPDIRILVGTNLIGLSEAFIRELRQYFENSELQEWVWNNRPHVEGNLIPALSAAARREKNSKRNNKTELDEQGTAPNLSDDTKLIWSMSALQVIRPTVLKDPTVQTLSVGTIATGGHYDLVILDDTVSFRNSKTLENSEKIIDWTRDLVSVLDPREEHVYYYKNPTARGGAGAGTTEFVDWLGQEVVMLGTRYYEWDLYQYTLDNMEKLGYRSFIKNVYVNGTDDTDGYLWPEKFNADVVEDIRSQLNDYRKFASQYLNSIVASEDIVLDKSLVKYFSPNSMDVQGDGTVKYRVDSLNTRLIRPVIVLDPAATTGAKSDSSVITVGGYDDNKELYILDVKAGKFTPTETIQYLFDMSRKWKVNSVTVEMVGGFRLLGYQITEAFKKNHVLTIRDYKPKGDKKLRIESFLQPHFNSTTIHLVGYLSNHRELSQELDIFPSSGHDDILDTFAIVAETAVPTRKANVKVWTAPTATVNKKYGGLR